MRIGMTNNPEHLPEDVAIEPVYTVQETAKILKSTPRSVLSAIRRGRLRAAKIGKAYIITETAINEFLEAK